jgi:hypothetical protein
MATRMELDHVFVLIAPGGPELAYLNSLGLTETYRRKHPGQGTENICFCFGNLFLECLWITSPDEAASAPIARTGLYERSQWRTRFTSPFGLAWRDSAANPPSEIPTWPFQPPYLPPGMTIAVATDSDDPRQPMMFKSPGSAPPLSWPPEKRGALQSQAGLTDITSVVLHCPSTAPPSPALLTLAANTILDLIPAEDNLPSLSLFAAPRASATPIHIRLPIWRNHALA